MKKWLSGGILLLPFLLFVITACENRNNMATSPGASVKAKLVTGATEVFCGRNPCNLACENQGDHVELTWSAADQDIFRNPDGYYIFRSSVPGGTADTLVQTMDIPDGSVHLQLVSTSDVAPGPGPWCYVVQAFRVHPSAVSDMTNSCCSLMGVASTPTPTPGPQS